MVCKAADDLEAIRAGMARIEEEKRRMLNGSLSEPQPVPVEEYQEDQQDLPGCSASHWGYFQTLAKPKVTITHPIGSWQFDVQTQGYEYWVGDKWVRGEDWQDNYQHLHHHKP